MKTTVTLTLRAFPVKVKDMRTGAVSTDVVTLTKEQLQAAQLVGISSKELVQHMYNREGYRVLEIGKPRREDVRISLSELLGGDKG